MEGSDLRPLLDLLVERIPAPTYDDGHPLQARVTNLDADSYVGRLALCRIHQGEIRRGQQVAWCRRDGTVENVRVSELYVTEGLERRPRTRLGRARSSRSPASPRSRSARRSPTPTTRGRCP